MPKTHELKIQTDYFNAIINKSKTFEIRKDDRDFKVGDTLLLAEYDPKTQTYSGYHISREVTYITDYAQKDNYVVMAIK